MMSTRVSRHRQKMRKQPKQERSRGTVSVILQAGAQVLARNGWYGFSTNAVAEAGGVEQTFTAGRHSP
jgi:hypothetical protein